MLTIRLQRTGKRNQADFRIVLAEKEAPVQKKFVEVLGSYNPRKKDFQIKEERIKYWLSQRVELSETIHNLFVTKGLLSGPKVKAFSIPKKAETAQPAETPAATAAEPQPVPDAALVEQNSPPAEAPAETAGIEQSTQ
jgi:small subunit ribosomal protein S16